ncbi:hypothetical protein JOM49_005383 [Amycolatopsis magusensis]|uniref:Uncharacterized protein n=1 Tax=Amycolatopsis magusensis TaxID=882444 RepID=A0ABS4PWR1_9PSEU|nr:hypothetical protein [Amycolatopsis magusensis]
MWCCCHCGGGSLVWVWQSLTAEHIESCRDHVRDLRSGILSHAGIRLTLRCPRPNLVLPGSSPARRARNQPPWRVLRPRVVTPLSRVSTRRGYHSRYRTRIRNGRHPVRLPRAVALAAQANRGKPTHLRIPHHDRSAPAARPADRHALRMFAGDLHPRTRRASAAISPAPSSRSRSSPSRRCGAGKA